MEEADPRPDTHDRAANLDLDRRRARTGIRHHRNEVGSLRIGRGDRIANRHRSELPAPVIELIAMQPVAQRDLARLRTRRPALRHNRRLLRRAPTSPSWCPTQHFNATETVPINWQITWHTIPLPRSNKADHPIAPIRCNVPITLRLRSTLYSLHRRNARARGQRARAWLGVNALASPQQIDEPG